MREGFRAGTTARRDPKPKQDRTDDRRFPWEPPDQKRQQGKGMVAHQRAGGNAPEPDWPDATSITMLAPSAMHSRRLNASPRQAATMKR